MACELLQREFTNSKGEPVLATVRQMSASKALETHVELIGKLGTVIFPFIENKHNFGDIIRIMQQAEHKEFTELFKRILSTQVSVDGKEVKPALYDMQFSGEMMLAVNIFGFVLEANYLSFFEQGLAINEQRRLEAVEQSKLAELKNTSPETT